MIVYFKKEALPMNIQDSRSTFHIVTVSPQERIDVMNAPELRNRLNEYIEAGDCNLVIDLSSVPFLDSAGMAVLVNALKRARLAGGDVKLVWPQIEAASRVLHLTKFDRIFDMAANAEDAAKMFR
jgi:anti-sigma B factor antagonist